MLTLVTPDMFYVDHSHNSSWHASLAMHAREAKMQLMLH